MIGIRIAVGLVALVALPAAGQDLDRGLPTALRQHLQSVVEGYGHALETNNRAWAMQYVHPLSASLPEIDLALRDQLATFMERVQTQRLEAHWLPDGSIAATVDQEFVRVFGLKFTRGTRRSIYEFRKLDDAWRIWTIRETPTHQPGVMP